MIKTRLQYCTIADGLFAEALAVIDGSGAAESIEDFFRESSGGGGGRQPSDLRFTVKAILVAVLIRFRMGRAFHLRGAMDTIGEFTPGQLAALGMGGQDISVLRTDSRRSYTKMHSFWSRRMAALDSFLDIPARRMPNSAFRGLLGSRTDEQLAHAVAAAERLSMVTNDILAASIWVKSPTNCVGDAVVDETLLDTTALNGELGAAPHKMHAASPLSEPWAREKATGKVKAGLSQREITKSGNAVGLTMLTRVAHRDALHSEPPLFIGMAGHAPTGGSVEALGEAIVQARRTGVDGRPDGSRRRRPLLTADMGYNSKKGFAELMLRHDYSAVVAYPTHWLRQFPSKAIVDRPGAPQAGPLQYQGTFFCPAVQKLLDRNLVPGTKEMLDRDSFRAHDRVLQELYPFLMGLHSRPRFAPDRIGRPRLGEQTTEVVKQRMVCPAAMGTVQCPLKPDSMNIGIGLPLAEPDWTADTFACCSASSVTVSLTPDQLRLAQWDLIPFSWEHLVYFEALRALTEQRFTQLKSRAGSGVDDIKTGPRRPPTILIGLALAAAAVNLAGQHSHDPRRGREDAFDIKWRTLEADLGYPPTRIPPRS
jgi:hypothetical protein